MIYRSIFLATVCRKYKVGGFLFKKIAVMCYVKFLTKTSFNQGAAVPGSSCSRPHSDTEDEQLRPESPLLLLSNSSSSNSCRGSPLIPHLKGTEAWDGSLTFLPMKDKKYPNLILNYCFKFFKDRQVHSCTSRIFVHWENKRSAFYLLIFCKVKA